MSAPGSGVAVGVGIGSIALLVVAERAVPRNGSCRGIGLSVDREELLPIWVLLPLVAGCVGGVRCCAERFRVAWVGVGVSVGAGGAGSVWRFGWAALMFSVSVDMRTCTVLVAS